MARATSMLPLLLLVAAAFIASVACNRFMNTRACSSPFEWNPVTRIDTPIDCRRCPAAGLATPDGHNCYGWIFGKRALLCTEPFRQCAQSPLLSRTLDRNRFEQHAASNASDPVAASAMMFLFSSIEQPVPFENFLIWKKRDCAFNASNFEFKVLHSTRVFSAGNSECFPIEQGDYVSVVCNMMSGYALGILPRSLKAGFDSCDIPAEVEAFGQPRSDAMPRG